MNKLFIGLIVLVLVLAGVFYFAPGAVSEDSNFDVSGNVAENGVKTFVLTGENFKFTSEGVDNPVLKVKEGDKVKIEFSSVGGFHDFVLDEFNASTAKVKDTDGITSVEFVADKRGTFEYYCSVGQHRANGMFGTFIVE